MGNISKEFSLLLVIIFAASSLMIVEPGFAQSIPKLSVPTFTAKFVNASYNLTTTNSYTGQSQTQLINNNSIGIMIKNQPLDYSNNGLTYQIYFNIRVKPHFSNSVNWTEVYPLRNLTSSQANENGFPYAWYISPESPQQSSLGYIAFAFPVVPTNVYGASGYDVRRYYSGQNGEPVLHPTFLTGIPSGAQFDLQVQALVGHNSSYWYIQHPFTPTYGGYFAPAAAYDLASGWSNTQTITIGETSTSTSLTPTTTSTQNPIPTPTVPEFFSWTIPLLLTIIVVSGLLVYHKKHNTG